MSTLVVRCAGHPAIRASHAKTIELTRDRDVTAHATCVIGVRAEFDEDAAARLRGRLSIRFEAGDVAQVIEATASSFYVGGDLVIRTGGDLRERTFAWGASAGASTLDGALVERLRRPGSALTVTITADDRPVGPGVLYVVAVPIGNDDDLSPRALRVLRAVDGVLAEDSRYFLDLLRRVGAAVRDVTPHHVHNLAASTPAAIDRLLRGDRLAVVSDAGTPGWSDPGADLVAAAVEAGIAVRPVPGPSAVTAAVAASGVPVHRVTFLGFLPRASGARRTLLAEAGSTATIVCFESARRVLSTLADVEAALPGARVTLARELTKIHEELVSGSPGELHASLSARPPLLGECTLVIATPRPEKAASATDASLPEGVPRLVRELLDAGVPVRTVAQAVARSAMLSKNAAYEAVLAARDEAP